MTIWTIGDSYVTHKRPSKKYKHLEDTWVERTSILLNQPVISHAKYSITVEYVFNKFNNLQNNFKENDIILISIPYFIRRWHFRKNPLKIFFPSEEEQEAMDYYKEYLININDIHETYLVNFMYKLDYLSKKLNLHTIVIPTFYDTVNIINPIKSNLKHIHIVEGALTDISYAEIKKNNYDNKLNEWIQTSDPRVNHLLRSNHINLSNKIIDNIKNKTIIDLKNGFDSELFDFDTAQNPNFITNELFDGIMVRTHRIKLNNLT